MHIASFHHQLKPIELKDQRRDPVEFHLIKIIYQAFLSFCKGLHNLMKVVLILHSFKDKLFQEQIRFYH